MKKLFTLIVFVVFYILISISNSHPAYALMTQLELQDLATESNIIVRGQIVEQTSFWFNNKKSIYTRVKMHVEEYLHPGKSPSKTENTIIFITPGGEINKLGMLESDSAAFETGENVVVFLRPDYIDAGQLTITGSFQGKWLIRGEANDTNPFVIAPAGAVSKRGKIVQKLSEKISYDHLKQEIKQILIIHKNRIKSVDKENN